MSPIIKKRRIGNVDILDVQNFEGVLDKDALVEQMKEVLSLLSSKCVILNIQEFNCEDLKVIKNLIHILEGLNKAVIYGVSPDKLSGECYKECIKITDREIDVVNFLGEELAYAQGRFIEEKRNAERSSSAVSTDIILQEKEGKNVIISSGIISNVSEQGVFLEYLDLKSAELLNELDYFTNYIVDLNLHVPIGEHHTLRGEITRVEISGGHTAIAIRLNYPIRIKAASSKN